MMRATELAGSYKRFLGSSFLSDFTLIICCESSAREQEQAASTQYDAAARQQEQEPGTPEKCLSPKSAAAASEATTAAGSGLADAAASTQTGTEAAGAGAPAEASTAATAGGDSPCSGQDQHGDHHADVVPQSPHRAAATAGVGPLSAAALQQSTATLQGSYSNGATAAAPAARQQASKLRPITTSSAAGAGSSGSGSARGSKAALEASANSSSSGPVIVMPVHGVVLAAASPYFETLLRGWAHSNQPLHMVVGEEQLAAAQQLVAFLYTGSLQPDLQQPDLLQLLLLADRFDVARALAAARRALASLSPECFEWPTLTGVWGLPQHLFEGDGEDAAALRGVAWERLLQLFGDLEEAWASADGRAMWQQLPWRAVSALVASDELAVASENTTFAAVSSWIAHQQHQQALQQQQQQQAAGPLMQPSRPSLQELQLLAASIRLPALGPCYMSYVCLQQDWFAGAVDMSNLARAAAFAAAGPEVRKDLLDYTAATTAAAMQAAAAAAAASGRRGASQGGGSSGGGEAAAAAGGPECVGSSLDAAWGPQLGVAGACGKCSSCGSSQQHSGSSSLAVALEEGSRAIEHRMQLMSLAQAMQRPRALSTKRAGQFSWRVDLAAIRQLYDDVAAAGSRDSRILRSPAHSFAGYEWALQLEVTQTRGATGFDVSKPWSLGVFLTCQVRLEQPDSARRQQQQSPPPGAPAAAAATAAVPQAAASPTGDTAAGASRRLSTSSGSSGLPLPASGSSDSSSSKAGVQPPLQQQQLVMQLVDFGFVSTSATIAVREAGGNKRLEKSWEHAVVRYRASWGWPNYLDAQAVGWDEGLFGRWLIDGQLHLSARVRVLG